MTVPADKLPLPHSSADLSAPWLTGALRRAGVISSSAVMGFTKETIGEGIGILGELVRVGPTYDSPEPGAPKTIVAKFASPAEENRELASAFGFYNNEVQFYTHLAEKLPIRVPHCYYVDFDAASSRFVLLLEDLGRMRLGDQLAGCTVEEAADLAVAIGRVHAQTWDEAGLAEHDWLPAIDAPHYLVMVPESFRQGWPAALERFPELIPDELRVLETAFLANVHSLQSRLARPPRCLCHGDYRLDNVFFGADGEESAIIDWQIAGRVRGPYDIAYFMSQSIDVADRRAGEREIIERYHRTLVEGGVRDYTIDECWEDYRLALMFCVTYAVTSAAMDPGNERGRALSEVMAERAFTAVLDLNTLELLEG